MVLNNSVISYMLAKMKTDADICLRHASLYSDLKWDWYIEKNIKLGVLKINIITYNILSSREEVTLRNFIVEKLKESDIESSIIAFDIKKQYDNT